MADTCKYGKNLISLSFIISIFFSSLILKHNICNPTRLYTINGTMYQDIVSLIHKCTVKIKKICKEQHVHITYMYIYGKSKAENKNCSI